MEEKQDTAFVNSFFSMEVHFPFKIEEALIIMIVLADYTETLVDLPK